MLANLIRIVLCSVYKMLFVFSGEHGYFVRVAVLLILQHAGETTISIAKLPSSVWHCLSYWQAKIPQLAIQFGSHVLDFPDTWPWLNMVIPYAVLHIKAVDKWVLRDSESPPIFVPNKRVTFDYEPLRHSVRLRHHVAQTWIIIAIPHACHYYSTVKTNWLF